MTTTQTAQSHASVLRGIMKGSQNHSDIIDIASEQDLMMTAASVIEVASRSNYRTPDESESILTEIECSDCGGDVELARLKLVKTTLCCACAAADSARSKQFGRR